MLIDIHVVVIECDFFFSICLWRTTSCDVGAVVIPRHKQSTECTMAGEGGHDVAQGLHVHLSGALLHVVVTLGVVELGQLLVFGDTVGEQGPPGRVHQGVAGLVLLLQTTHFKFIIKTARSYRNVNIFNSFICSKCKVDFLKTARSYWNIFSKTCTLYVTYVNIYGAISFLHALSKFRYCHDTCIPITRYCSGFPNHISVKWCTNTKLNTI